MSLFTVTKQLVADLPSAFLRVDAHNDSDGDWESSDCLWLELTPESSFCEGEYIAISMLSRDGSRWDASFNSADRFGGHSLLWNVTGTSTDIITSVKKYLSKR